MVSYGSRNDVSGPGVGNADHASTTNAAATERGGAGCLALLCLLAALGIGGLALIVAGK